MRPWHASLPPWVSCDAFVLGRDEPGQAAASGHLWGLGVGGVGGGWRRGRDGDVPAGRPTCWPVLLRDTRHWEFACLSAFSCPGERKWK